MHKFIRFCCIFEVRGKNHHYLTNTQVISKKQKLNYQTIIEKKHQCTCEEHGQLCTVILMTQIAVFPVHLSEDSILAQLGMLVAKQKSKLIIPKYRGTQCYTINTRATSQCSLRRGQQLRRQDRPDRSYNAIADLVHDMIVKTKFVL